MSRPICSQSARLTALRQVAAAKRRTANEDFSWAALSFRGFAPSSQSEMEHGSESGTLRQVQQPAWTRPQLRAGSRVHGASCDRNRDDRQSQGAGSVRGARSDRGVRSQVLNEEVPEFRSVVPTTENLAREVFRRLRDFPGAKLQRVRIEETSKNSFEFLREDAGS